MYKAIVVDDEKDIRTGMQTLIEWPAYGFEITGTAGNGISAIELLSAQNPELVLTDIKMPEMDGLTLARYIHTYQPETHVIIISGYGEFAYAKQAMQYSVENFLLKPIDADELSAALLRIKYSLDNSKYNGKPKENLELFLDLSELSDLKSERPDISEITDYIIKHSDQEITLNKMGEIFFRDPFYIGKLIKKTHGLSFNEFLNKTRVEKAKFLLSSTNLSTNTITEKVGYKYRDHFYRIFKRITGQSPGEYRDIHKNQ